MRTVILLVLLAGIGWKLDVEQRQGRFQQADDVFLDFLLANVRDRFVAGAGAVDDQVVLVRMREEDKAEYGAWPPAPIDWQMVLKGLVPFDPEVVVITTPLSWGQPPPEFVAEAGAALLPFTSVVLAAEVEASFEKRGEFSESIVLLRETLPSITHLNGDPGLLPVVSTVTAMPDEIVRRQMELGPVSAMLLEKDGRSTVPFAFNCGDAVVPSLALQALSRYTRTPYARQRLLIGPGAGAHLGGGVYVPLDDHGRLDCKLGSVAASVNALDFMTGTLADGLSAADKALLGKKKIIVLGTDHDGPVPTQARIHAAALSHALSLPRVHAVGMFTRWVLCGVAGLTGCFLLRYRGWKALRAGLLLIFALLVVSFVTFQSSFVWSPPAVPAALLAASTVFAMLFGRKPVVSV